ncbi:hypothetical protein [Caulobacter sp.]|uniref:hypothetical protein n=1 Tax=Caulobacter sp. TaxID=78 RepID=UPI003BAF0883
MRPEEAQWIGATLAALQDISPVLELGSSTLEFRTVGKPHIDRFVHAPLRERGVRIVTADLKEGDGIEISGNFYEPRIEARLRAVGAKAILCCNIFEHLEDRAAFAAKCDDLLPAEGFIVVTVPYSYPLHYDPIDTYFRPTPAGVAALFPRYRVVHQAVIESSDRFDPIEVVRTIVKSAILRGGLQKTKARLHRLLWLFRPYKISAVVLQKPA